MGTPPRVAGWFPAGLESVSPVIDKGRAGWSIMVAYPTEILVNPMKSGIHPNYVACKVYCACTPGEPVTEILSTVAELKVDICSKCHPYYTGKQKLVDSAGRVEKFLRRYGKSGGGK